MTRCPTLPAYRDRSLLQAMSALVSALDYDLLRFSLSGFIGWMEEQRNQRQILLMARTLPPSLSGAWLSTEHCDYIFYDSDALVLHQRHIQLHELSHILCGHEALVCGDEEDMQLAPSQQASALQFEWQSPFLRLGFPRSHQMEREAEFLASLIHLQILGQKTGTPSGTPSPRSCLTHVLQNLHRLQSWLHTLCPLSPLSQLCEWDDPALVNFQIYQSVIDILDRRRKLTADRHRLDRVPALATWHPQTHGHTTGALAVTQPADLLERLLEVKQDIDYPELIHLCCELSHHLPPQSSR
jgi:hypothetical protein